MRLLQYKNERFHYKKVICADVFCGTGQNEIGDEIVDGSPIRLLRGFFGAIGKNQQQRLIWGEEQPPYDVEFWFSDIRKQACSFLKAKIKSTFDMNIDAHAMAAQDSVNEIANKLHHDPDIFLFLILDPNGPKSFPKNEVQDALSAYSNRIDVIPYISATTINRCISARNKAGRQFSGWLGDIENFDEGFVSSLTSNNRAGWIRKPIPGDKSRWTMIPTFGILKPGSSWDKQGYVNIDSEEGRKTVKHFCGGNNE